MGNSQTKSEPKNASDPFNYFVVQDWAQVPETESDEKERPFTILRHKTRGGLEVQKYYRFFNTKSECLNYTQSYFLRKRSAQHSVAALHMESDILRGICSTHYFANVYIERIPHKLSDLGRLTLGEALLVMKCGLKGYQSVFQTTGYFQVSQKMVGINRQGKPKVWINQDYSLNHPDFKRINHNQGEPEFILHLIQLIQNKAVHQPIQPPFSQFLVAKCHKQFQLTFHYALTALEEYCILHRVVPSKIVQVCETAPTVNFLRSDRLNKMNRIQSYSTLPSSTFVSSCISPQVDLREDNSLQVAYRHSNHRKNKTNSGVFEERRSERFARKKISLNRSYLDLERPLNEKENQMVQSEQKFHPSRPYLQSCKKIANIEQREEIQPLQTQLLQTQLFHKRSLSRGDSELLLER